MDNVNKKPASSLIKRLGKTPDKISPFFVAYIGRPKLATYLKQGVAHFKRLFRFGFGLSKNNFYWFGSDSDSMLLKIVV